MNRATDYKIETTTQACRQACLGAGTPLTYYRLAIEMLRENPGWSDEEIDELRHRFVDSLLEDFDRDDDLRAIPKARPVSDGRQF